MSTEDRIREVYDMQRRLMAEQRAWVEHVHAHLPTAQALAVLRGTPIPPLAPAKEQQRQHRRREGEMGRGVSRGQASKEGR